MHLHDNVSYQTTYSSTLKQRDHSLPSWFTLPIFQISFLHILHHMISSARQVKKYAMPCKLTADNKLKTSQMSSQIQLHRVFFFKILHFIQ